MKKILPSDQTNPPIITPEGDNVPPKKYFSNEYPYDQKAYSVVGPVSLSTVEDTKFVYDEDKFNDGLMKHIKSTHSAHYSGGIQTVEFIMENAESLDYLKGNVVKYIQRFGKKDGNNVVDLYKAIHYVMMMAYYADKKGMTKK